MWTWFEGWTRSYPDRKWERRVSGGSPTFAELHRPAEWIADSTERDYRYENLASIDWRAEWHWTPATGWQRVRSQYHPALSPPVP